MVSFFNNNIIEVLRISFSFWLTRKILLPISVVDLEYDLFSIWHFEFERQYNTNIRLYKTKNKFVFFSFRNQTNYFHRIYFQIELKHREEQTMTMLAKTLTRLFFFRFVSQKKNLNFSKFFRVSSSVRLGTDLFLKDEMFAGFLLVSFSFIITLHQQDKKTDQFHLVQNTPSTAKFQFRIRTRFNFIRNRNQHDWNLIFDRCDSNRKRCCKWNLTDLSANHRSNTNLSLWKTWEHDYFLCKPTLISTKL